MKIAIIKLLTKTAIRLYRIADRMLTKEITRRYCKSDVMATKQVLNIMYGGENNVNNKRRNPGDSTSKGCTRNVDANRR